MKMKRLVASSLLIASFGIAGCSADEPSETTKKETRREIEEVTRPTVETVYESYFGSGDLFCNPPSDLEGQSDYMVAYPALDTLDWDAYPMEPMYITDFSVIEDEDVRKAAEYYADNGFYIQNPVEDQVYGQAFGDNQQMFAYGFQATSDSDRSSEFVMVYKMNETLFDYYFVEWNNLIERNAPVIDDGTVIRYGDDSFYVEFNRDTGIAVLYDRNYMMPSYVGEE